MNKATLVCAYSLSVFPTGLIFTCGVDPANSAEFINKIMIADFLIDLRFQPQLYIHYLRVRK